MNWQNIIKNQKYQKGKKYILNGLSILQQHITANMLQNQKQWGETEHIFEIDKTIDGFNFGRIRLTTNEYGRPLLEPQRSEVKERVVSIIKELEDSDLKDYDIRGFSLFVKNDEKIDIDIRRTGK
tara:strand:- start:1168 stop:1542 length:375 start_codon:yes stop_codon:yes gene_type:complete